MLWLVPRRLTLVGAGVWVAAVTSPAVMLGIERGNPDLIVFSLIVLALALLRRRGFGDIAGIALLVFTAMLKLFPAFALGVLIRRRPRAAALTLAAATAVLVAYALVTLDDIREIREVLPKYAYFSFSAQIGVQALREGLGAADTTAWRAATALALAAVVALAAVAAWRRRERAPHRQACRVSPPPAHSTPSGSVHSCTLARSRAPTTGTTGSCSS